MSSIKLSKLGNFIEKVSIKAAAFENYEKLQVFGVSNIEGITITLHNKSKDISKYQFIDEGCFAYNPYRINVGSIGLTPKKQKGLVSPAYVVFRTKPEKLIPEMLLDFLKSGEGLFQINKYARGTVRKALRYDDLCKIEIPDIPIEKQITGQKKKKAVRRNLLPLQNEITHQQTLLKKLHQSILQDAISGKLTKKWRKENPDVEPASELLKRIKEEKERMVKEKKIKKQKPLPPIKEDEIPFELPKGWVWCRLGEICDFITKGTTPKAHDFMPNGEIPFLKVYNIVNQTINFEYRPQYISKDVNVKFSRSQVYSGDVLMNIVGPPLGKVAIVPNSYEVWNINQALAVFRPVISGINKFLYYYLCEGAVIYKIVTLGVVGQDNISLQQSREMVFALPAIYEIPVINKKIEDCFAFCEKLEKQIDKSYNCANSLQEAVLKEAFDG
ncbi:MAG: restriction endonuclease subunit S [Desulfobacterales bacterium]|nr:restriction endonuclease subunit S [Desulfobacterales bacterium]